MQPSSYQFVYYSEITLKFEYKFYIRFVECFEYNYGLS